MDITAIILAAVVVGGIGLVIAILWESLLRSLRFRSMKKK